MTERSHAVEAATRRLAAALDGLEAVLEERQDIDRSEAALAAQVAALAGDRSRLAFELDVQTGRAQRLDTAGREISRRLDSAMDAVRAVVNAHDL